MKSYNLTIKYDRHISARSLAIGLIGGLLFYLGFVWISFFTKYNMTEASYPDYPEFEVVGGVESVEDTEVVDRLVEEIKPIRDQGWETYLESLQVGEEKENWIKKIAWCESRGNPNSINSQAVGSEHATGLLQFLPSTWERGEKKYLKHEADIMSEYDQIDMGLAFYDVGQQHEWACNIYASK